MPSRLGAELEGRHIFITGGAGFIGVSIINRLVRQNEIAVYDNLERNALKESDVANHPNLRVIRGDILDFHSLKSAIPPDTDTVIHLAAIAGIDTVIKNPVKTMEVNMVGTYNLLRSLGELSVMDRIERLVNFSTSEVFGIQAFRVEESAPTNLQPVGEARWTYSVSKLAGEHLVYSYHKQYGLRGTIVRPFNVYGPGQIGEGAIHNFVTRAIRGEPLVVHGDGDQIRSWCYIDDLVDAVVLILSREVAVGEVFNIGNPRSTITVLSLAEKVVHLSGSRSSIQHVPKTYRDVELRIPNIDKAMNLLGFHPRIDLDEGLGRTIEWYRKREQ